MFICMILASALFVIFAILFLTAGDSLAKALIVCNVEIQTETIKKTQIEMNLSSRWFFDIWDTELNNLWSRFSDLADPQTKEKILAEQRNWIAMKQL